MPDSPLTVNPLTSGTGGLKGTVTGGRQPIAGAATYLYGAPDAGYSTARPGVTGGTSISGISLLGNIVSPLSPSGKCNASVIAPLHFDGTNCYYQTGGGATGSSPTDTIGAFNLTGLYQCNVGLTSPITTGQQVWIYLIGGTPGVVTGTQGVNVQAGLAASLGTCGSSNNFSSDSFIYVNEVSTVAFAYAVAGFATDATHISAPSSNYSSQGGTPGLTNAFGNAAQLYNIFDGPAGALATTPGGNGTAPQVLINSLADVIASCINSVNAPADPSIQCQDLFQDVYGPDFKNGSFPSDTASAMIFIAQNPSAAGLNISVGNLLNISDGDVPWLPNYTTSGKTVPNDLTAAVIYNNVTTPVGIAVDASGDAYVASSGGNVYELSPTGATKSLSSGDTDLSYVTIDPSGNIWTPTATSSGNLYEISSGLGAVKTTFDLKLSSGTTLSSGPHQIASDANGTIYIADAAAINGIIWTVTPTAKTPVADINDAAKSKDTCTVGVTGIAYDPLNSDHIWSVGDDTGTGTDNICQLALTTGAPSLIVQSLPTLPIYVAIDSLGNAWATSSSINGFYEVSGTTGNVSGPFNVGGLSDPSFLTIDGLGDIWIINNANSAATSGSTTPTLSEFDNAGFAMTPASSKSDPESGYQFGNLSNPSGIAIDQSGDVWVTNNTSNTVFELIGAAAPTKGPLVLGPGQLP
jgi:hypothetical protein